MSIVLSAASLCRFTTSTFAILVTFAAALDAHAQWVVRETLASPNILAVIDVDPSHSARVFASQFVNNELSLFSTDDEGATWQSRSIGGNPHPALYSLVVVPNADGTPVLYASVRVSATDLNAYIQGFTCALLRSVDRGETWSIVNAASKACQVIADPSERGAFYANGDGYPVLFYPRIMRSPDGGVTWTSISGTIGHTVGGLFPAADGRVYATSFVNSVSPDHGATWSRLDGWPKIGNSPNNLVGASGGMLPVPHPVHGDAYALVATDNGLYQTTDGGATFQHVGLRGFSVGNLRLARRTASGDILVTFGYQGGIGLLRVLDGSIVPLQNGLGPDMTANAYTGGRYASTAKGLAICDDLDRCIGGSLPKLAEMVEFHNTTLDHYFMTSDSLEAAGIDAGAAGPGWSRTGLSFSVYADSNGVTYNAQPVCRFYGTPGRGPNSHFFTVDPGECDRVRQDAGWKLESSGSFTAFRPNNTFFPDTRTSAYDCGLRQNVYRLYNNRSAQNDSNHRHTSDRITYIEMQANGWVGEGVRLCAAPAAAQ